MGPRMCRSVATTGGQTKAYNNSFSAPIEARRWQTSDSTGIDESLACKAFDKS